MFPESFCLIKGEPQVRKKSSKIGVFSAIDAFPRSDLFILNQFFPIG